MRGRHTLAHGPWLVAKHCRATHTCTYCISDTLAAALVSSGTAVLRCFDGLCAVSLNTAIGIGLACAPCCRAAPTRLASPLLCLQDRRITDFPLNCNSILHKSCTANHSVNHALLVLYCNAAVINEQGFLDSALRYMVHTVTSACLD